MNNPITFPIITVNYEDQQRIMDNCSFTDAFKHLKLSYRIDFHSFTKSLFELISKFFDKIQHPHLAEVYRDKAKKREYRICHLEKKLAKDEDKKIFGKDLLVHTRNMPQLHVLTNYQLEAKACREWLKNFKKPKTGEPLDETGIEKFFELKLPFEQIYSLDKTHGVCYSIALHFIRDYLDDPEQDIVKLAEKYKRGGNASVTAFQSLYETFNFIDKVKRKDKTSKIMHELIGLQWIPSEQQLEALKGHNYLKEKNWTRENINAIKRKSSKEERKIINKYFPPLSHPSLHANTQEQLLASSLAQCKKGAYRLSFTTKKGKHTISYINKGNGEGYLFDPGVGLIRCEEGNHANTLLKVLYLYQPKTLSKNKLPDYELTLFENKKI